MPGYGSFPLAFHVNGNRQYAYGYIADLVLHFTAQAGTMAHDAHDYAHMPMFCGAAFSNHVPIQFVGFSQGPSVTFDHYGSKYDGTGHLVTDPSTAIVHVVDSLNHANDGYFLYHNAGSVTDVSGFFF